MSRTTIKTEQELEIMAEGGKILAKIMQQLAERVKPGVATQELNKVAKDLVLRYGARPAFEGYQGFPATLCTSVNEAIVHALPSGRALKEGDIISLDLGILHKGFYTDMALTLPVGEVRPEASRLIRVTKKALKRGLKKIRPGNTVGDIGNTIERYVTDQNFKVVKDLCGHGIGRELHEEPQVFNWGKRGRGEKLREGMVICLEPMAAIGSESIKKSADGFGYVTSDGSWSAHFEHTVAVTRDGYKVLTMVE